ncbi:hypothetical protein ACLGIH_03090 [Streptomyces sp. HMX87]|uniref:hypothetical protein n=1 Tax=Streptomyces sp. HMX87 TaxID=3390849 RepID=UPI003A83AE4B
MISTRRILAAVGLAAGAAGLAAPMASAADAEAGKAGGLSVKGTLDWLAAGDIPAEYRDEILPPSAQLNRLNDVNQLHQVTGLVSPLFGLAPAIH